MKTQQVTWKGKFFLDRQKLVLRSAKKRGHTQCNKQYTQKKPTQAPENKDKNLEKSKGSHNIISRKFRWEGISTFSNCLDHSAFGPTVLHIRRSFSCTLPKYTKINKSELAAKLLSSSSSLESLNFHYRRRFLTEARNTHTKPKLSCLVTMNQNMISWLFTIFTKKTSINQGASPLHQHIYS